jgi:hypothetical protein
MKEIASIIDRMIEINRVNQERHKGHELLLSVEQFIQEFCSVWFDIGRRVGKTSYILDRLQEGPQTAMIVGTYRLKEHAQRVLGERHPRIYTYNDIRRKAHIDLYRGFTTIFIDEPCLFPMKELYEIYAHLNNKHDQVFVHLGIPRFN